MKNILFEKIILLSGPISLKYFLMPSEKDKISILYGSYKKYLPLS